MGFDEPLKSKRDEILRLAIQHGERNVRVFGSAVRGESGVGSDVDCFVAMEEGRNLLAWILVSISPI